ncbi:MAG TPA: hypothetical protein VLF39_00615 [Candidatus Saccharimonadales bacterium]|nr:hypothetical protein [Candidatus Saccharimonadales bacterium]
MKVVSGETHERHQYIDRTIDRAIESFREPDINQRLGSLATKFTKRLSAVVVANISNGQVLLPNEYKDDEVLPITAVYPGESFTVSDDFDRQTQTQQANTQRQFELWEPRSPYSVDQVYNKLVAHEPDSPATVFTIPDLTEAYTGTLASVLDAEHRIRLAFLNGPDKGIALVKMKPMITFTIKHDRKHSRPEDVAHELVHVEQIERKPVLLYHSQKSVDMQELRGELEAYHIGSILSVDRLQNKSKEQLLDLTRAGDHGVVQVGVERARQEFGIDPLDPYRPSPPLIKELNAKGLGAILHGRIDYQKFVDMCLPFQQSDQSD